MFNMGAAASKHRAGRHNNWLIQTLENHESGINCMVLSDDGSVLATGSDDNTIRLWSTKTESVEYLSVLAGHVDYITHIVIADNYLLSASADQTIRKWDMPSGQCLFICTGHTSIVNRMVCTGN
jgi:WD40 repeat protein